MNNENIVIFPLTKHRYKFVMAAKLLDQPFSIDQLSFKLTQLMGDLFTSTGVRTMISSLVKEGLFEVEWAPPGTNVSELNYRYKCNYQLEGNCPGPLHTKALHDNAILKKRVGVLEKALSKTSSERNDFYYDSQDKSKEILKLKNKIDDLYYKLATRNDY